MANARTAYSPGVVYRAAILQTRLAPSGRGGVGDEMLDVQHQNDLDRRLRRIEGQVQGIRRMVGEPRNCIDILQQLAAVSAAIASARVALFRFHVRRCVSPSRRSRQDETQLAELIDMVAQFCK
jgi:DNA-binding FrmR family transcriptional regulator